MPNVNGKKFPYTAKGKKDAAEALAKNPSRTAEGKSKSDLRANYPENRPGKAKSDLRANYPENRPGSADKARKFFARREALKKISKGKMK